MSDVTRLAELIEASKQKTANMTEAEREAMFAVQRESYVRAEFAMGNDAMEARWREAVRSGDDAGLAQLRDEQDARAAAYDAMKATP
jgi:hypothetical protein